jgi:hypothetical protein
MIPPKERNPDQEDPFHVFRQTALSVPWTKTLIWSLLGALADGFDTMTPPRLAQPVPEGFQLEPSQALCQTALSVP